MDEDLDIEALARHGMKYMKLACYTWIKREEKLKKRWSESKRLKDKSRCMALGIILWRWHRAAYEKWFTMNEAYKKGQVELEESFVMLECRNFQCRYGSNPQSVGLKYKHYLTDSIYPCPVCNDPMELKEQRGIDKILNELLKK